MKYVRIFEELSSSDIAEVGGKNASLAEMLRSMQKQGIKVPLGFATTSDAYRDFLDSNELQPKIAEKIEAWRKGGISLKQAGASIRKLILQGTFSLSFKNAITAAYRDLSSSYGKRAVDVAVRSSATAEDLPEASFAGQHETFLNIRGELAVLDACKKCIASAFTNRALTYRERLGYDHLSIALSAGIQKMVRSDKGASGVMFSIDTDSGFPDVVLINATWGLGEPIVQGEVAPDEYIVYKPLLKEKRYEPIIQKEIGTKKRKMLYASGTKKTKLVSTPLNEQSRLVLSDEEILILARWAVAIEEHYGRPMDIEWAKDGLSKELYIVQARPETVHASSTKSLSLETHKIIKRGELLLSGVAVGNQIASGPVLKVRSPKEVGKVPKGAILVTETTNPDWVPLMKSVQAVVTDQGGRTSHAAIVSRELGLPAIVGTGSGTKVLKENQKISVSCAEGAEGHVYQGDVKFKTRRMKLDKIPQTKVNLQLNLSDPDAAVKWWKLPSKGVGLARMEFIVSHHIQIHPMALVHYDQLKNPAIKRKIAALTKGFSDKKEYFIQRLAQGIARIAALHYPHPVIVRFSDFKTNEYAELIGGQEFEPEEENPMLGWRGASRYYHPEYEPGFALECQAIKRVREVIGMKNVKVMIPFCRTIDEAKQVLRTMKRYGLARGRKELEVYVMCEIPSNVILAEEFAQLFDGFSIGSNDLTQLLLGVDRDSERIAPLFDEGNAAVTTMIREVIQKAHKHGCKVGFCGQAPSDRPAYAQFLVEAGIDSISVTPDSFLDVIKNIAKAEKRR